MLVIKLMAAQGVVSFPSLSTFKKGGMNAMILMLARHSHSPFEGEGRWGGGGDGGENSLLPARL